MKKILLIMVILIILSGCKLNEKNDSTELLIESNDFNEIIIDDVKSLDIIKYTVGGMEETLISSRDEIIKKYNYLSEYKIGDETNRTCEDNTVIYKFKQSDKVISIEIECGDVLVKDNIRYELVR